MAPLNPKGAAALELIVAARDQGILLGSVELSGDSVKLTIAATTRDEPRAQKVESDSDDPVDEIDRMADEFGLPRPGEV